MTLPPGWDVATLPELIETGGIFSDGDWVETKDQDPDGEIRLTQLADVGEGFWRNRSERYMTAEAAQRLDCTFLEAGDVLVARMPDPLGRACVFPGDSRTCVTAVDVCIVRPGRAVDSRWLMWWLNTPQIRREVLSRQAGTTRKRISRKNLATIPLPIPPLAEQRRIVAAVEEQLSRLDAVDMTLRHLRARAGQLRLAVLRRAFAGGWPTRRIADVAAVGSGATPKRSRDDYWLDGDIPWVTSGQVMKPFIEGPAAYITQKALNETNCRIWPAHTLLVAMYGEGKTRGHCSELLINAATNQACAAISRIDASVDRRYLKLFFASEYEANRRLSAGGVQPNLSLSLIKEMRFPCPPRAEQEAIVETVENELAAVERMASSAAATIQSGAALRRSILATAFRGELVPQHPDDEPASVLLERVAAERASASKPARKRRERARA